MAEPKSDVLRQLNDIICDHKPYAVMGLDTIVKDKDREIFHAVIQKFSYNDTENQYKMKNRLELMQKCSQSISQSDLERLGIIDTYNESALDSIDFSNKLTAFVVEELDDSLLIVNGNNSIVNSLTKVKGCELLYADKEKQGLALKSSDLIGDYLKEHDASGDTPRAYLKYIKSENTKAVTCDEKVTVVSSLVEQCRTEYGLSAEKNAPVMEAPARHKNTFESDFDILLKEFNHKQQNAKEEQPITETLSEQKVQHIEMDFTPEQQATINALKEQDEQIREAWSEKGKKAYREGTVEQKMDILKRANIVSDKSEDMTALHEIYQLLDRESGDNGRNNGFTVLQAGTTGFQAGDRVTQIAFATYDIDKTGKAGLTRIAGFSRLVCADMEYVQKAEQLAKSGGFDVFAHGGIDLEKYKALCEAGVSNEAEKFCTVSTLSNTIAKYFEAYPVSQYPIVSAGKATGKMNIPDNLKKKVSYSQGALLQSVNNENLTAEPIEFTQVIKEYTMAVRNSEEYNGENVLFPNKTLPDNLKNFGLDAIAEQNGRDITGAAARCFFMADMIEKIQEQYLAMEKAKNQQKEAEQAIAKAEAIQKRSSRAIHKMQEENSGYQEETFEKHITDSKMQPNNLNQNIMHLNEMAKGFTESMTVQSPAPQNQQTNAELTAAIQEQSTSLNNLSQAINIQNINNSRTDENMKQLIVTIGTMINTLQANMQAQKEESRLQKEENKAEISMLKEQIKAQKEENAQLLRTIERKDELYRQILNTVKQLAEVAVQTQGQFINVNERLAQTQEQNISIIENQNTHSKIANTLVQEVAAVKADGADTKESLAVFKEETRESFDKTNQAVAQQGAVLERHETEIENVKAETRETKAELRKIAADFGKVAKNSAATIQIVKSLSDQLETMSENQNTLATGFVEMGEKVEEVSEEVKGMYILKDYMKMNLQQNLQHEHFRPEESERTVLEYEQ